MAIGISMIMLTGDTPIRVGAVQQNLSLNWPQLSIATQTKETDGTISFQIDETMVIMGKMPAPIPWRDLEGPCSTSFLWRNATHEVKQHSLHWLVTIMGNLEPVPLSNLLTQVTAAAMAACPPAIGVYWPNAALVIPKRIFIDFAKDVLPKGPPLYIWVDFRVGKDSEKTSAGFTHGMQALGHMEFETQQFPEPPPELHERLMALARYVIENGPVIRDGDTVGNDAEEHVRVIYSPSAFGHPDKVLRPIYESPTPRAC